MALCFSFCNFDLEGVEELVKGQEEGFRRKKQRVIYSETTGAIKNLAALLKLQAVNSTGMSNLE